MTTTWWWWYSSAIAPAGAKATAEASTIAAITFFNIELSLIRYETRGRAAVLSAHYRNRAINRG